MHGVINFEQFGLELFYPSSYTIMKVVMSSRVQVVINTVHLLCSKTDYNWFYICLVRLTIHILIVYHFVLLCSPLCYQ